MTAEGRSPGDRGRLQAHGQGRRLRRQRRRRHQEWVHTSVEFILIESGFGPDFIKSGLDIKLGPDFIISAKIRFQNRIHVEFI